MFARADSGAPTRRELLMTKVGRGDDRAYNHTMPAPRDLNVGADPHYFSIILSVTFSNRYFPVSLTVTTEKLSHGTYCFGGGR